MSKSLFFVHTEQSDVVVIKFQTFHVAVVWKGCFKLHLFGNAPICASTVLECSCCKIHRSVAAPLYHRFQNSWVDGRIQTKRTSLSDRSFNMIMFMKGNPQLILCLLFVFWLMTISDCPLLGQSANGLNFYDGSGCSLLAIKRLYSVIFPSASRQNLLLAGWRWRRKFT